MVAREEFVGYFTAELFSGTERRATVFRKGSSVTIRWTGDGGPPREHVVASQNEGSVGGWRREMNDIAPGGSLKSCEFRPPWEPGRK